MTAPLQILLAIIQLFSLLLLARIILSWIPSLDRRHPIVDFLYRVTEPVLAPVRNAIPPMGAFDISPLIVFLALHLLQRFLMSAAL